MKKNAVALILSAAVFVLMIIFAVCDLSAETDTKDTNQAWKSSGLDEIHAVRGIIYDWIKAWQSKDLDGYMSYYSPDFRSEKVDYRGWRGKKELLFKRPGDIFVEISNLLIYIEKKEAKISFIQEYTDAYLSDAGQKNMILLHSNGRWKIVSEEWQPVNK